MDSNQKRWIDNASYSELLEKIRTEPPTSEWFQGETGQYLFDTFRDRTARLIEQEKVDFQYLTSSSSSGTEQIYMKAA